MFASIAGGFFALIGQVVITLSGPAVMYAYMANVPTTFINGYPVADMAEPMFFILFVLIFS